MREIQRVYDVTEVEKRTIEEIGRLLSLVYRRQYEMIGERLKRVGLTTLQSVVLVNIFRYPGLNQKELAELISIDKATVSRILSNLESRDLFVKKPDKADHRYNKLFITTQGEQKVRESLATQINMWSEVIKDIPQADREELRRRLARLGESFGFQG